MPKVCSLKCVKLDKPIVFQVLTRTADGQGGYTEVWGTHSETWAQLTPKKGYEKFGASQMLTPVTHEVILRYRSNITTAMRFTYAGRTFNIKEVLNIDEANVYLKLTAVEMS